MANRTATFNDIAQGIPTGNQLPTASMQLIVKDSSGNVVATDNLSPTATTATASVPVGTGYTATLTAFSGAINTGTKDNVPPVVTFDVPPPPAPPAPPDPTFGVPVIS